MNSTERSRFGFTPPFRFRVGFLESVPLFVQNAVTGSISQRSWKSIGYTSQWPDGIQTDISDTTR